jgi:PAT family acetyl-CoA transporter-like MFS transporter 1
MATKDNPNHPNYSVGRSLTNFEPPSSRIGGAHNRRGEEDPDSFKPFVPSNENNNDDDHNDRFNYAILIALYTLQGIPMGLSASIPFLIQQKLKVVATAAALDSAESAAGAIVSGTAARLSYNANAIFALCSWPFSLKLLWAPIVDACYVKSFGRRKSWLIPVQSAAGLMMVLGSNFVERQLGLGDGVTATDSLNVRGVTSFFFGLYFLMATQGKS